MKAFIIVDLQYDFIEGGALAVPEGEQVVGAINQWQPLFDLVVATQDWHPANHESFAQAHPGHQPGQLIDLHGLPQVLWPVHCVQHTHGAELVKELDTTRIRRIFQKGTDPRVDSYSGFFDNGRRQATGLAEYLRQQGVTEVYVAGLATDYCVKFTTLDAASLGFSTFLLADGCRGVNLQPQDSEKAIQEMQQAGVQIIYGHTIPLT